MLAGTVNHKRLGAEKETNVTRRIIFSFVTLALFLFALAGNGFAADGPPLHALAMHGEPQYAKGFAHFDYANPGAPQGGALRLGAVGTFDSLHPLIVRGQPPQGLGTGAFSLVFESLMTRSWDEPFTLYGLLAESVEVPEDRSGITFNLSLNARWQDGRPVTADDVLFSFAALREQGRPNHRTYYKKVAAAEKLGPRKVRFLFRRNPDGTIDREMPLIMGLMPVLPEHDWKDRPFNQTTLRRPVGSGPYKVGAVDPGRSITYERDRNYWGRNAPSQRGVYNFDVIRIDYYRDDSVALQAFKAGQFDLRRETDPNKWAEAYRGPAAAAGRIRLERFAHRRPEAAYGFVFNVRRPLFRDEALREALGLAFDFEWINRTLFHGLYTRTASFFPNAGLAASGLPEGKEKTFLEAFRARLPATVFTASAETFVEGDRSWSSRDRLLQASALLKKAGYILRGDALYAPDGAAVAFEILLGDPSEEKIALEWARNLKRLGVEARTRAVDSAQFQARLTSFDYDVTTARWFNSLSPGNEQMFYWGSAAADQPGSRNYPGVRDSVVDALAAAIPAAETREDLVAAARALDRVLLAGRYVVPFYHLGADLIAYWPERAAHPDATPLYGPVLETWWAVKP